jgi:hypothetical protein
MKRSLSRGAVLTAGFVAVIAFLLTGCLASLQPFYTPETLTTDDAIIGVWGDKDDATWTFSKEGEVKTYTLIVTEKQKDKKVCPLDAHLVKLDGKLYLDISPSEKGVSDSNLDGLAQAALIPGHFIFKLQHEGEKLTLSLLEYDWVDKQLQEKPGMIAHARLAQDRLILTASTAQLQKWIQSIAEKKGAWGDPGVLTRSAK